MLEAPIPDNDLARIQALEDYDVLDTRHESHFDDIAQIASHLCGTSMALISLVDRERQFFKSSVGMPDNMVELPRNTSFCGHALALPDVMEIPDALEDTRFSDNPLVTGEPHIRFYAGVPLRNQDGFALGTLCVLDPKPGTLDDAQRASLISLARLVMRQLEQRRSERFSRHIGRMIEQSDYFVAMVSFDSGGLMYTNNRLRAFSGVSEAPEDLKAVTPSRIFPALSPQALQQQLKTPESESHTRVLNGVPMFSLDGEEKTVRLQLITSTVLNRSVLLLVAEDMEPLLASRREAERAASEVRNLAHVARLTQNPVIITDAPGNIQWVNPSFEQLTGYTLAEVEGKNPGRLLQGPETSPVARARIRQHLEAGLPVRQEILNYTRSGRSYWLDLDIQPVRNITGELVSYVAIETDITQSKEQEKQLLSAKEAAEASNRAKSQFLANISHELRTPLNGIVGISELLRKNPRRDDLAAQLTTLNTSSQGLLAIINDLLDLSKIEADSLSLESLPFNLHKLLQDLRNLFQPLMDEKQLRLHLVGLQQCPRYIHGDSLRLRQVLTNLLGNALKFTDRGFVELAVELESQTGDINTLNFKVRDSGIGIPPAAREKVFQPFAQADDSLSRRFGGTGLGLTICRRLVTLMGGDLALSSVERKGSTFSFTVPLLSASEEQLAASGQAELERDAQDLVAGCRVLVVDDNPINRQVAAAMLEELGALTAACKDGKCAIAAFEADTFDLAFIDIQMPDMDGFTLAQKLRPIDAARGRRTPFIALTAYSTAEYLAHKGHAELDGHVCKPLTFHNLSGALIDHVVNSDRNNTPKAQEPQKDPQPESKDDEPLIDQALVMRNLNGDQALINTLVQLFNDQYEQYIDSLVTALAEEDLATVASAAHSLKGAVGYFNNGRMWRGIAAMEQQAKNADLNGARHSLVSVRADVLALAEALALVDWQN